MKKSNQKLMTLSDLMFTQDAYILNECTYTAHAVDQAGDEYTVNWEIINHHTDDESEACYWDQPYSIIKN